MLFVCNGNYFLTYKDSVPEYYFKYAHSLLGTADYTKADNIR